MILAQRLALALVLAGLCGARPAAAGHMDCRTDKGPVTDTICHSREYRAMVGEIRALMDRAMAGFTPEDRKRLIASDAADRKRRAGCAWAAHNSAHPGVAVDECVRASLESQVRALRVLVERGGY